MSTLFNLAASVNSSVSCPEKELRYRRVLCYWVYGRIVALNHCNMRSPSIHPFIWTAILTSFGGLNFSFLFALKIARLGCIFPLPVQHKATVSLLFSVPGKQTLISLTPCFEIVELGTMSKYMCVFSMLMIKRAGESCFSLKIFTSFKKHSNSCSSCDGSFWLMDVVLRKDSPWRNLNYSSHPLDTTKDGLCVLTNWRAFIRFKDFHTGRYACRLTSTHSTTASSTSLG